MARMRRWTAIIAGLGALGAVAGAALFWRGLAAEYHAQVLRSDAAALESYLGAPEDSARGLGLRKFLATPGGREALCRHVLEAALDEAEYNRRYLAEARIGIVAITRKGIQSQIHDGGSRNMGGGTQLGGASRERFLGLARWLGEIEGLECRIDDPPSTVRVVSEADALQAYHRAVEGTRLSPFGAEFCFLIEREAPEAGGANSDRESSTDRGTP